MELQQIVEILNIDPKTTCPPATGEELSRFEARNRISFAPEHRRFLRTVTGGGFPANNLAIPTENCNDCAGDLHGVYGIGNPSEIYDIQVALDFTAARLPNLVPYGYDQGNGQVFVDIVGKPGRVVFVPWDELVGKTPIPVHHVADSIADFLEAAVKLAAQLEAESETAEFTT